MTIGSSSPVPPEPEEPVAWPSTSARPEEPFGSPALALPGPVAEAEPPRPAAPPPAAPSPVAPTRADAFPLLREVDGVIAVMRLGRSTRDSAQRLREQMDRLEAPLLGIVANGIKVRRGGKYGYGYYGGYYGPPAEKQGATERGGGAAAGPSSFGEG